jgi:hypothetical protein
LRIYFHILLSDTPVVRNRGFKEVEVRLPVIELSPRGAGARVIFTETTCSEDEHRRAREPAHRFPAPPLGSSEQQGRARLHQLSRTGGLM